MRAITVTPFSNLSWQRRAWCSFSHISIRVSRTTRYQLVNTHLVNITGLILSAVLCSCFCCCIYCREKLMVLWTQWVTFTWFQPIITCLNLLSLQHWSAFFILSSSIFLTVLLQGTNTPRSSVTSYHCTALILSLLINLTKSTHGRKPATKSSLLWRCSSAIFMCAAILMVLCWRSASLWMRERRQVKSMQGQGITSRTNLFSSLFFATTASLSSFSVIDSMLYVSLSL